ncbi:hypothetical protein GCM10028806_34190 [Spirosoma terrae]|uniref:Uncharacterized protein n=1 Tax=Spirosoma terrae TaxID=1968276 RepID=A0A6L9L8P0_9BACT|nr:hypothetical protein [Spirosoma terrae]NDU95732.1 hypothetical protein [Spirosoma terrae]
MAEVQLIIQGGTPPYSISIKAEGDNTERCTDFDYASYKAAYNPVRNGQVVNYTVVISKAGCEPASTTFQKSCPVPQAPQPGFSITAVTQPACVGNTPTNASASISNIVNADRYKLLRDGSFVSGGDCTSPDGIWSGNSGTVLLPPPPVGQTWNYVIRAFNGANCGDWFDMPVTISTPSCQTPGPATPSFNLGITQPTCTNGNLSNAVLNVTAVSNGDRYNISEGSTYQGSNDCVNPRGTFDSTWVDIPVPAPPAGESKTYTVRIWKGTNCGDWLDKSITVTSPACTAEPVNPSFNLSVDQPVCVNNVMGPATLKLSNITNGNRYRTYQGSSYQGSNDCSSPEGTFSTSNHSISVAAPPAGQGQYWTVRIWNGVDCSKWYDRTVEVVSPQCDTPSPDILGVVTVNFHYDNKPLQAYASRWNPNPPQVNYACRYMIESGMYAGQSAITKHGDESQRFIGGSSANDAVLAASFDSIGYPENPPAKVFNRMMVSCARLRARGYTGVVSIALYVTELTPLITQNLPFWAMGSQGTQAGDLVATPRSNGSDFYISGTTSTSKDTGQVNVPYYFDQGVEKLTARCFVNLDTNKVTLQLV